MAIYERLADLEREGGSVAIATIIRVQGSVPRHEGSKMLIFPEGSIEGTIGGGELEIRVIEEALRVLKDGKPRILKYTFQDPEKGDVGVCGGEMEVFVEALRPNSTLVVVGGGHVGKAVAHLASWLGFRVVVSDDRPDFATPQAMPDADEYITCEIGQLPQRMTINEETYLVLTTRGMSVDVDGLPELLDTPAAFIGVIGSRRRWETTAKELIDRGVTEEKIARAISPIGLEINAETPEEIAVSILAQIIMLRRGGTGETMAHTPQAGRRAKER
ncbi:MAG TPA: XdhC family protein [Anaerolineae bacterium]|nr:XdhC family protein [Anaerolineae bacterium]